MTKRDELYRKFSPILIEALFDQILAELNELRTALNKPPITKDAFLSIVEKNLHTIVPYNWMQEQENFPP